jgi:uncharacterized protein YtpQ (UPF0354 family)
MADLIHAHLGARTERREDFSLEIIRPDKKPITFSLRNIYIETQPLTGEERATRLRSAVLGMDIPARPTTWDDARPNLLPAVRAISWTEASGSVRPLHRPFLPFIDLMYAIDSEHAMTYATERDADTWGVAQEEIERAAHRNLHDQPIPVADAGQQRLVVGPDGYASSWLTVPEALVRVAAELGDEVIVLAPARDQLRLVAIDDIDVLLSALQRAEDDYRSEPRRLSPIPYLIGVEGLTPWQPDQNHPARARVDRAHGVIGLFEYEQQREVLQASLNSDGQDVFVAQYALVEREDGSVWSWAAWVKQVTAGLVPRVDVLLLGDNDNKGARLVIRWDDAMAFASESLHPEPTYRPQRWLYEGWPSAATLEVLREKEIGFPPTRQQLGT